MDIKPKIEEYEILTAAEIEIAKTGTTSIRCPYCNEMIVVEKLGNSYQVKCKSEDCLKMTVRGI